MDKPPVASSLVGGCGRRVAISQMTDSKNAHFTGCHVAIPSPSVSTHTVIPLVFRSTRHITPKYIHNIQPRHFPRPHSCPTLFMRRCLVEALRIGVAHAQFYWWDDVRFPVHLHWRLVLLRVRGSLKLCYCVGRLQLCGQRLLAI